MNSILADGRWKGAHGIGRFSEEVLPRLKHTDIFKNGPHPLSVTNIFWQSYQLYRHKNRYKVFFTPGFNPVIYSSIPVVFTIHDLIHLRMPGDGKILKKIYYELLTKPAAKKAFKILTVSDYSKKTIMEWANIPEEKIVIIGNGVSDFLKPEGKKHEPGYEYLFHVGNTRVHKNVVRLVEAFAMANIDKNIRLVFTGKLTAELENVIEKNKCRDRIIFSGPLSETLLAEYYRGAKAVMFPSLYEGFGIPVIEGMATGVPVLTSNVTSLPEIAGDAALLVDPYDVDDIANGIEQIVNDDALRKNLIEKGLVRAKCFTWEKTAKAVQEVLDSV